ncbi:hypothetical protein [Streptomyces sp. TRM70350]|uniref:hypothetical protein n=1 Tax=Streptomyces sp. TRM70350 TaxID=2856165 RepID=UPI00210F3702|nr:hypothetical protein [Streptomyces sp. TRM70350]
MTTGRSGTGTAAEVGEARAGGALTALLTCAMAFSMMQLFLPGALGPRLVSNSASPPPCWG